MEKAPQQMTRIQLSAAFTISGIALAVVIARQLWPNKILLDQATLGLLALAALPWLTLFFKKFKIPGVGEAETQDRTQGTTQKPLPPASDVQPAGFAPKPLSPDTLRMLATLWRYQRQYFDNDSTKRWTFTVHPFAKDYPQFLAGLAEAVNRGWVVVSPENHQCMLTNEGLKYVENSKEVQQYDDVYKF